MDYKERSYQLLKNDMTNYIIKNEIPENQIPDKIKEFLSGIFKLDQVRIDLLVERFLFESNL